MSLTDARGHASRRLRLRIPFLLFIGALLMQCAWIIALPPFRGIDEFDHAYRAAAVANGQWAPSGVSADRGRGDLVAVPASLVKAAAPVCSSYKYTGPDNCRPVEAMDDGRVLIASAASRYSPLFYWLIGTPASHWDGAQALTVMRLASATMCSVFIALAGWSLSLWARGKWLYMGLLLALSPVLVYSTSLAAPNGLEMSAGLCIWTALIGITRPIPVNTSKQLIVNAIPGLIVLCSLRQLGPMFCALIVLTTITLAGATRARQIYRQHWRLITITSSLTLLATIAHLWWIHWAGSLRLGTGNELSENPVTATLKQTPLWLFQTVAAFPTRNEQAPIFVYAIWLPAFAALIVAGVVLSRRNLRVAVLMSLLLAILLPIGLTLGTISTVGAIWQGRYGLPFAIGIPLLSALSLEQFPKEHRLTAALTRLITTLLVAAHAVSVQSVFLGELKSSPLTGDPSWPVIHDFAPLVLVLIGGAAWAAIIWSWRPGNLALSSSEKHHVDRESTQIDSSSINVSS